MPPRSGRLPDNATRRRARPERRCRSTRRKATRSERVSLELVWPKRRRAPEGPPWVEPCGPLARAAAVAAAGHVLLELHGCHLLPGGSSRPCAIGALRRGFARR